MTTLNVIVINFHTQLTTNLCQLAFQLINWYIVGKIAKFHIVSSTILIWVGLVFLQLNNLFLSFAINHFNNSEFNINLLISCC